MAWLQTDPSGNFHVCFRFGGKKFKRSLKTRNQKKATSRKLRLEETIQLLNSGRIDLPANVDVPTFLLSDGKLSKQHVVSVLRLGEITTHFFDQMPKGSLEPDTIKMMRIHERHILRLMGKRFNFANLGFKELQDYINKRSKEKGRRGRTVGASTIKKEIVTLRAIWRWAIATQRISKSEFPSSGLRYPKTTELPIFQTIEEIVHQTKDLDPDSNEAKELWSCVFLNRDEIEELLDFVQETARHPFIYPMFVFAAHTGARRGEILRSQVADYRKDMISIRERKRKKRTNSMRHVPMSTRFRKAIGSWLELRPSSPHTFCNVEGKCKQEIGSPITISQSNKHFRAAVVGSRFQYLRGWHAFRHSFCSNCAAQGIDQRIIDEWVGHTTEEMTRRYQHLFPNKQRNALDILFG